MNYEEYLAYLGSGQWARIRGVALLLARHHCQLCNSPDDLEVHHRTYEHLGHESCEDTVVLCYSCHRTFSSRLALYGERPGWMRGHDTIARSLRRVSDILPSPENPIA